MKYKIIRTFYLFLLCLIIAQPTLTTGNHIINFTYNIVPTTKDLQWQKTTSQCRLALIPLVALATLYCNKSNITSTINQHPLLFIALCYGLGNYILDTWSKYRQLTHTLHFFIFSQTMCRYLLCLRAIKNSMNNYCIMHQQEFDDISFAENIKKYTGHTIEELELFTFEILKSSIQAISNSCTDNNQAELEEKIYFLFKEEITLEQVLLTIQDDATVYPKLLSFYENPQENYDDILKTICDLIRSHFNYFFKKSFTLNLQQDQTESK